MRPGILRRIGERLHNGYTYFRFCFHGRRFPGRVGWRVVLRSSTGWRQNAAAAIRWAGVLLSRSARRSDTGFAQPIWHRLVHGPLEVHQIEGDHGDMFEPPQVARTAEICGANSMGNTRDRRLKNRAFLKRHARRTVRRYVNIAVLVRSEYRSRLMRLRDPLFGTLYRGGLNQPTTKAGS